MQVAREVLLPGLTRRLAGRRVNPVHFLRSSLCVAFACLLFSQTVLGFQDPEEEKKRLEAEREKKAFEALMTRAEEEYRIFFTKPETVPQFWAAIKFEVDVGKYDLAALHLKQMLALPPEKTDADLLKLLDHESLGAFTRLQTIRVWSVHEPYHREAEKNVQILLDRVKNALENRLSDPKRINFFIENLSARTREEREFAKAELNRSKERAVPYLIDALRLHAGKSRGDRILEYMVQMEDEMIPPLLEVFKVQFSDPGDDKARAIREKDAREPVLRLSLMNVIKERNEIRRAKGFTDDLRLVPYLWHIAGGEGTKSRIPYHPMVREKAREMLAYFLRVSVDRLPRAEVKLTELAERYYQKKETFGGKELIPLWRWNSVSLSTKPVALTRSQALELFATRHAQEALDIAPAYQPAQVVLLSMQMYNLYRLDLNRMLLDRPPAELSALDELLAGVDVDLLARTLEKAMNENDVAVILGSIRALARRGDVFAAKLVPATPPRGLVRALDHPDRRVQWAAVQAIVRMPLSPPPVVKGRMLDLIKRQLLSEPQARVLAVGVPDGKLPELRATLKELGYVVDAERDFKKAFARLKETTEYELVFLHASLGRTELPYHVNQLRLDVDQGVLPIIVLVPTPKADKFTTDAEARERAEGLKVIEARLREEVVRKKGDVLIKISDVAVQAKLFAEIDAAAAVEKARRFKEFEETFDALLASRRLATIRMAEEAMQKALIRHRNVNIVPELHLGMGDAFKKDVEGVLDTAYTVRLGAEERTWFKKQALGYLWDMSKGEIPGYSVAPARDALVTLLETKTTPPEQAQLVLEILSRLPGAEVQQRLAAVSLDPTRDKLRIAAAVELNHHIRKFSLLLPRADLKRIQAAYADSREDPTLRTQLALVLGSAGTSARVTGDRLFEFRLPDPPPPPAKKEKEKEKKDE